MNAHRHNRVGAVALALLVFGLTQPVLVSSGVVDSVTPAVVFLKSIPRPGAPVNGGTGFLVTESNRVFLVTADHVRRGIAPEFRLVVQGNENRRPFTFTVRNLHWSSSKQADVAVAELSVDSQNVQKGLLARSMPVEWLRRATIPPSRDIELVILGFPKGLGTHDELSPVSVFSPPASGVMTLPRFDTSEPATFFLLQDPSISGMSGGPVLDVGRPEYTDSGIIARSHRAIVGLVHGRIGNYAAVVPASDIIHTIEDLLRPDPPARLENFDPSARFRQ